MRLLAMLTVVCTLKFADGLQVTGEVQAASPAVPYPIHYSGALNRLPMRYDAGTASDLELTFTMAANRSGAKLSVERSGSYDSRAEDTAHASRSSAAA
jgi:hypothetical protein